DGIRDDLVTGVQTCALPILRPGRFERRVVVGRPDVNGREAILRVHTKKIPLGDNVELSILARGTPGLAGADLANLVNEAALNAADRKSVGEGRGGDAGAERK